MDQRFAAMHSYVHLDKQLGSVQVAEEQPPPARCREGPQRAPLALLLPAQDRKQGGLFYGRGHLEFRRNKHICIYMTPKNGLKLLNVLFHHPASKKRKKTNR